MKRTITILTIALVGLSACTETNLAPEKLEKGRHVSFLMAPIKNSQTRAESTVPTFSQDSTFGTTAFAIDAAKNWNTVTGSSASIASDISETNIKGLEISYQDGVWKSATGESYYWDDADKSGKNLTFLSWSPYTFGGTSTTDLVTYTKLAISDATKDFTYSGWKMKNEPGYGYTYNSATGTYDRNQKDGSVDLLLARSTDCNESNSAETGVVTEFCHQLCNVKFKASILDEPDKDTNGNYVQEWHITKVVLSGIYTQADLLQTATKTVYKSIWGNFDTSSASEYTYDVSTSPIDLVYIDPKSENYKETDIFPQTLMLPQSVLPSSSTSATSRVPKITITYKDKSGTEQTMSGALATNSPNETISAWLAGRSITYHVYITSKTYWIDFDVDASASKWTDADEDHKDLIIGNDN